MTGRLPPENAEQLEQPLPSQPGLFPEPVNVDAPVAAAAVSIATESTLEGDIYRIDEPSTLSAFSSQTLRGIIALSLLTGILCLRADSTRVRFEFQCQVILLIHTCHRHECNFFGCP